MCFFFLAAHHIPIFLEQDFTSIVLVEDCVAGDVALHGQKVAGVENYGHKVVGGIDFSLSGTLSIQIVFVNFFLEYHDRDTCIPQSASLYWVGLRVNHKPTISELKPSQH